MIKTLWISVLFLVAQNAFADAGTSHIIKAKIILRGEEHVGYFMVWGYLYLTTDSLEYDVPKFTRQVKGWVYGDTIKFYSEIIFVKDRDLTILPVDKSMQINKNDIDKIYPLALIEHNRGISSYTRLRSADKQWILGPVRAEKKMIIERDELCTYSVLYFNDPDGVSTDLVRDLELALSRSFASGEDNAAEINPLIERLRKRKILILTRCSPS